MPEVVLLDTGPLVAVLDEDEEFHAWATGRLRGLTSPLVTCEAVLTEASFLLKDLPRARLQIRLWIQSGFVRIISLGEAAVLRALTLMERYANVPMHSLMAAWSCWRSRRRVRVSLRSTESR